MTTAERPNIANVSWGDHLVFGKGDGRLATVDALRRRAETWRDELDAGELHWRQERTREDGRVETAPGYDPSESEKRLQVIEWDDFAVVPEVAREMGMDSFLYVPIFDEGRPLASAEERAVSHHNAGHGRERAWQSNFTAEHPEYLMADRAGTRYQWGVPCLAYPEVREHLCNRFTKLLEGYEFDGLFVCFRSQSRPADFADEFGFNEPVREEYMRRYRRDILTEDFDVQLWRDLLGEYLTAFVADLREATRRSGHKLSIGCPRGDVIGPPLGNATLRWREWVERGLVDELVINQSSSQCPSLWIQLWPMHRGYGYTQNYIDGRAMGPLMEQLTDEYGPAFDGKPSDLYVARQWASRSESEERELLTHSAVKGLTYSAFRHDNADLVASHTGEWVIGK